MSVSTAERTKGIYPSKIREVLGKVEEFRKQGVHITDFSIGRPDFDTPGHIKAAAKEALDKGQVHYTASQGTRKFQEAVCHRFKEDFGLEFAPEDVFATVGASQAIYLAFQGILDPGDEVIAPQPMYVYYGGLAFLAGAKVVSVPISDDELFIPTAEKLAQYITPKTKAILLTSPNNPTGQIIDRDEILKIAELAAKHDLIVVSDDIYNAVIYDGADYMPIAKAPGMKERTIVINSFSKTYAMDGWRIGSLIVPHSMVPDMLKLQQHIISCPNTFVQAGAVAALTESQECAREMTEEFDRRRKLIMSYFDDMNIPYVRPRGAFYIFPDMRRWGMNSKDLALYLLKEARIATVPGDAFGAIGEGHIRIAFSTSYEEIDSGMQRMMEALKNLK
ncbi:MAG: pyridoxal phosphate-dependent aminotransferase [Synergistaceae bacterium]|nr:pyridoxal phosphate-dependent aminotransferase [Synergistaceae bacterium]